MIVLGFDTATRATAVALRLSDGRTLQARDDPDPTPPAQRPGHATRLLDMADELLGGAGIGWSALQRIAVGRGPGTFTGLRIGVATARGLAQSLGIELVGVSSLRALAEGVRRSDSGEEVAPAGDGKRILAVLDARRGEAFAAAYLPNEQGSLEELVSPRALPPEELGSILAQAEARLVGKSGKSGKSGESGGRWLAVGDGAVRFRGELEAAGVEIPAEASPVHLLSAEAICELGARTRTVALDEAILPEYGRRPDAEIALERRRASGSAGASGGEEAAAAEASSGAGRAREVNGS